MQPEPQPPPPLMDELIEEILLRLPPNDPVMLFRAALVCKNWCRLIAGSSFRRHFRKIHRMTPVLGFLYQDDLGPVIGESVFLSTSTFRLPYDNTVSNGWVAVDSLQSRILFSDGTHSSTSNYRAREVEYVVWNPITGEVHRLPMLSMLTREAWNAALICTAAGCDHLNCDNGPFSVVWAGIYQDWGIIARALVYSSEKGVWGEPSKLISVQNNRHEFHSIRGPSAHVGNAVFFEFYSYSRIEPNPPAGNNEVVYKYTQSTGILAYDLDKLELSLVRVPSSCEGYSCSLMATNDGKLGFTTLQGSKLSMWSREGFQDGGAGWAQRRVIELNKMVPDCVHHYCSLKNNRTLRFPPGVFATADGHDIVFIRMCDTIYTVDLKSGGVVKLFDRRDYGMEGIVPYITFCIPGINTIHL
ncbi:hypothetical protein EJB05_13848, partial [Eragrostis curvula]